MLTIFCLKYRQAMPKLYLFYILPLNRKSETLGVTGKMLNFEHDIMIYYNIISTAVSVGNKSTV